MSASELALIHGTGCVGAVLSIGMALVPLREMIRARAVGSLNGFDTRQLPVQFVNFYIWAVWAVQVGDIWVFLASSPSAAVCLFNITSAIALLSQEEGAVSQLCKPFDGAFFRRSPSRAWHDASREQRGKTVRKLELQTVGGFLAVSFISCFLGKWELAGLEVVSDLFPVSLREEVLGSLASMAAFVAYCRPIMRLYTYCCRRDASPILLPLVLMVLLSNTLWTIYGVSTLNPWVYVPNGSGALVCIMQVLVRLIFPGRADRLEGLDKAGQAKDLEANSLDAQHGAPLRLSSQQSIHEDYLLWQKDYYRWRSMARTSNTPSTTSRDEDAVESAESEDGQLLPNQASKQ
ncbi:HET-E1 [Symbiodinium natans]|uniref:HET-E1 protein n=1 Tax=Symbiodinium natans TaxID=878477 RepID=A0A812PZS8_9DINO|nr:HET-E1 [Symbiodinium natans]